MFNLDTTTIRDKESILKIINEMTTKEKETTDQVEVTTYVSVFENPTKNADTTTGQVEASTKKEMAPIVDIGLDETTLKQFMDTTIKQISETTENMNIETTEHNMDDTTKKEAILAQYFEAYDEVEDNNVDLKNIQDAKEATTTTTTTTSTTTTTTTTTTTKTTTKPTTTTTKAPTILERAGQVMSGGIGGIINGLANVDNALGDAASPFWLPISFGRKKRAVETAGDTDVKVSNQDIFKNFVLFQQRMKAMNPQKFKDIVKQVVKTVVSNDTKANPADESENLYDELIQAD